MHLAQPIYVAQIPPVQAQQHFESNLLDIETFGIVADTQPPDGSFLSEPTSASSAPANHSMDSQSTQSTSLYRMTIRTKAGIFKPHYTITSLLSVLVVSNESKGFKFAIIHPHWLATLREELNALHAYNT